MGKLMFMENVNSDICCEASQNRYVIDNYGDSVVATQCRSQVTLLA